jgi:hypothetical protein
MSRHHQSTPTQQEELRRRAKSSQANRTINRPLEEHNRVGIEPLAAVHYHAELLDSPAMTSSEAGQYLYGEHDDELLGRCLSPVPDDSQSATTPHCTDSLLSLFASKIRPLQFAPVDGEHIPEFPFISSLRFALQLSL